MPLTIEMHNPVGKLMEELTWPGITQEGTALTYAFIIAQTGASNPAFREINEAIRVKWKGKGSLERIKTAAWKQVEEWHAGRDAAGIRGGEPTK